MLIEANALTTTLRRHLVVQSNGGTAPGEDGGRGVGEVALKVDCPPVEGLL